MAEFSKGVPKVVMTGDHISTMPARGCMVTKRVKYSSRAEGQEEAVDVLRPSHHLIATWHSSSESRCMFKPTEGMAETQELACGAETDSMQTSLAGEAEETKIWNMWVPSFKDWVFC